MMIYFLRHQAGGILTDYPFTSKPTAKQIAPIAALMRAKHGASHPKTKEEYWLRVVEIPTIGDEVPVVQIPVAGGGKGSALANTAEPQVSGTGRVVNPGDE